MKLHNEENTAVVFITLIKLGEVVHTGVCFKPQEGCQALCHPLIVKTCFISLEIFSKWNMLGDTFTLLLNNVSNCTTEEKNLICQIQIIQRGPHK